MIVPPAPFLWLAFAVFLITWLVQPLRKQLAALPWWKQLALPIWVLSSAG